VTNRFVSGVIPADTVKTGSDQPSLWFAFRKRRLLVIQNGREIELPNMVDISDFGLPEIRRQYLGELDGQACISVELEESAEPPDGWAFLALRRVYQRIPEELFWVAGRAVQIVDWDRTQQYCGRCGARTLDKQNERAKECPQCGLISYPRISPAIIVLVERDGKILLARAHRHPPGFYSVLAGFVEPGETLEEAVAREIKEEVGIEVNDINYFGSQPWPYPNSLMVAFTCTYSSGDITIEEEELEDAGWYSPDNLPPIPPKISIARQLIDWFSAKERI
jgi:NAD+ diphosphatase